MKRDISEKGLDLIKSFEGCRLKAYLCPAKVWTIGWGHTGFVKFYNKNVCEGMTITLSQADELLKNDCQKYVNHVNTYMKKYSFNQNQFDALVSFAFNIGNIKQLTKNGTRSITQISNKIPEYRKANGKVLTGLIRRRNAEKELFDLFTKSKSYDEIAREVIEGKWGNGEERKNNLTNSGYMYSVVQSKVNSLLKR